MEHSLLLATFARMDMFSMPRMTPLTITKSLLPLLHVPPLLITLFIRRGPPLHLPMKAIYPAKIYDAIPEDHDALNPTVPNVIEEVQATVPEFLIFSYATDLVRKGYLADSMDVWDLPVLSASLRESHRDCRLDCKPLTDIALSRCTA